MERWDEVMDETRQLVQTHLQVGKTASVDILVAMKVHQLIQQVESRLLVICLDEECLSA